MAKIPVYTLRQATAEDLPFLFKASTEAMRPVTEVLNPGKVFDQAEEFEKYKEKFDHTKIQIVQYQGQDAGRLRVVRSVDSIYVGGIQLLPEFQGKGIGKALFADLIEESNESKLPITLEVHHINERAMRFYKSLGFIENGAEERKAHMIYKPS